MHLSSFSRNKTTLLVIFCQTEIDAMGCTTHPAPSKGPQNSPRTSFSIFPRNPRFSAPCWHKLRVRCRSGVQARVRLLPSVHRLCKAGSSACICASMDWLTAGLDAGPANPESCGRAGLPPPSFPHCTPPLLSAWWKIWKRCGTHTSSNSPDADLQQGKSVHCFFAS